MSYMICFLVEEKEKIKLWLISHHSHAPSFTASTEFALALSLDLSVHNNLNMPLTDSSKFISKSFFSRKYFFKYSHFVCPSSEWFGDLYLIFYNIYSDLQHFRTVFVKSFVVWMSTTLETWIVEKSAYFKFKKKLSTNSKIILFKL